MEMEMAPSLPLQLQSQPFDETTYQSPDRLSLPLSIHSYHDVYRSHGQCTEPQK